MAKIQRNKQLLQSVLDYEFPWNFNNTFEFKGIFDIEADRKVRNSDTP